MLLNDHGGLYGPGNTEPGDDPDSVAAHDEAGEREEEILWRSELVHRRTGLDRLVVLEVLQENDRITAEADAL